ncbi:MAG: methyltransferase domain-containing protein [Chitinophagaceae bacterium]|nr:methyltransferase domain-containing protein [Chitinophagaceae bacterium]
MKKNNCPVCSSIKLEDLYRIEIPVLQNRVFETLQEAKSSAKGNICLTICNDCHFGFNSTFENEIIIYDTLYDNSVPSKIFLNYYNSIAEYLYKNYNLSEGILYDIGCGKGTFLKLLCDKYPDVVAVGIDPSYEGELGYSKNLNFIQDFFSVEQVIDKPSLVISRHVFEHIEYPTNFLKVISNALNKHADVPFFIEVPDLTWIIKNEAYWDICYEHCNYFSPNSLNTLVHLAKTNLTKITPSFQNQYLWCEGIINPNKDTKFIESNTLIRHDELLNFINNIKSLIEKSQNVLKYYLQKGYQTVVWGMATKGVEYCNLVDAENNLINYCVDINESKQNKFIPLTGHQILSPEVLQSIKLPLLIVVMNENYLREIKDHISLNRYEAIFVNGHGEKI